jgi:uncharacterized protein YndB with AHSA1/START domain
VSRVTRRGVGLGSVGLVCAAARARADSSCTRRSSEETRFVSDPSDRILAKSTIVPAGVDRVWQAWTTSSGIKSFLGCDAKIELHIGGAYEIYFSPDAPVGQRGSEGARVLSYLPRQMLSFSWNAPPKFGPLRSRRTWVVVAFAPASPTATAISLSHLGWGRSPEWDALLNYFDRAWGIVLTDSAKIAA